MALLWYPDFCQNGQCAIELDKASFGEAAVGMQVICPHHQGVKNTHGLTDAQLFDAIRASSVAKERARWTIKQELALLSPPACRVNPDGSFTFLITKVGVDLPALRAKVDAALTGVEKPLGASAVKVE